MQLEQEKFNTLKEIAEMQEAVSLGRAELRTIKAETETYLVFREKEAVTRIIKVLEQSRDALDEITKNHNELSLYKDEIKAFATELKNLSTDITDLFKDFNERMKKAEEDLDKYHELVSEKLKQTRSERIQIGEDRKLLAAEKADINKEKRLLADRRGALERAWDELNGKLKLGLSDNK